MRQAQIAVIAGAADEVVVHKFDGRRIEAGFDQVRHQSRGFAQVGKDGQYVKAVRAQGDELQRRLRNDAQRAFRADDQLVEAEACRALFQRRAEVGDLAVRQDDFNGVYLMTGRAIAHSFVAAGVGSQVAADEAAVGAARVAGVQQAFRFSQILNVDRTHARFDNHVHVFFVDFQNAVHPFHQQDDAMVYRHGAAADAGAGASRRNGNVVFISDLDDFSHFFRIGRQHDDFRRAPIRRRQAFVRFIHI